MLFYAMFFFNNSEGTPCFLPCKMRQRDMSMYIRDLTHYNFLRNSTHQIVFTGVLMSMHYPLLYKVKGDKLFTSEGCERCTFSRERHHFYQEACLKI